MEGVVAKYSHSDGGSLGISGSVTMAVGGFETVCMYTQAHIHTPRHTHHTHTTHTTHTPHTHTIPHTHHTHTDTPYHNNSTYSAKVIH